MRNLLQMAEVAALALCIGDGAMFVDGTVDMNELPGVVLVGEQSPLVSEVVDKIDENALFNCFAVGECIKCSEDDKENDQGGKLAPCLAFGYKQENACLIKVAESGGEKIAVSHAETGTMDMDGVKNVDVRIFRSCNGISSGDDDKVVKFEVAMIFGAAISLYVVQARKSQVYQRLSSATNA